MIESREQTTTEPTAHPVAEVGEWRKSRGLRRSVRLFRAFRVEQTDPAYFYSLLAEDTVGQLLDYCLLADASVVDVGGGAGYFGAAVRARGAQYYLIEPDRGELTSGGEIPRGTIIGDGYWLPLRDGAVDVCFSSNVLEHVPDPGGLIDEMIRVTRPGGIIYVSFTNWLSPWGGHETAPWHYLGGEFAVRRYQRRHGQLPKNRFRHSLFPVHVGQALRLARSRHDAEIIDALPRYYPRVARVLLHVPVLREFATWNLLMVLRRNG
ncbi:class I SAM-dependent methyltransferase [Amycolatopsis sp. H20-H5]|uniref:class I SAM-dependent methyltransferase n=1 Tax=Amycolatopsis sp. H20-H5 TaxID=3046309 RepID=UPI002DB6961B|nr:class I SAM-dependent methyltransferase [Amycolatopsis sp. H20-H5]MEC3980076.1 class I SAM-dependent methyltransferase [Amycolatopsis sp. H20-H5]